MDEHPKGALTFMLIYLVFTVIFLLLAYAHPLVHLVRNTLLNVPGMRLW